MRIIFAGTPDFAVAPLKALLQAHEVVAVYTQPDRPAGRGKKLLASPVKQVALNAGLDIHQPDTLKRESEVIAGLNADVMVVVAYGMILPESMLFIPRYGCINIHASLLPRWRGAAPIQRAIQAGDAETGVSIMRMAAGLDTGPVFEMLSTAIQSSDTSATVHDRLSQLGAKGILSTLTALAQQPDLQPTAQDDSLATYAHKIRKSEAVIDWSLDCVAVHNQIRAFVPWPVAETQHKGTRIRLWESSIGPSMETNQAPAGTITDIDETIQIACGSGLLRIHTLQKDGGRAVDARQFCNGYALEIGDRFGSERDA